MSNYPERKPLIDKLRFACRILTNGTNTFSVNEQPFKDLKLLIKLRDDTTHFKGEIDQDLIKSLQDEDIFTANKYLSQLFWSTEPVRWGHNVICKVVVELKSWVETADRFEFNAMASMFDNYRQIQKEDVAIKLSVDLASIPNESSSGQDS